MEVVSLEDISDDLFLCGQCKLTFTSLTMFLSHKREPCTTWQTVRTNYTSLSTVENFELQSVDICNSHLQVEQYDDRYQCSNIISQQLNYVNGNEQPSLQIQESTKAKCSKCHKNFKNMANLCVHYKTHDGNKPFQCLVCGRCFSQNTHLQRHLHGHRVWPDGLSNTVPVSNEVTASEYSCSYCSLLLPDYTKFRIHLKSHISKKMFKCIQGRCSELFYDLEPLLRHVSDFHTSQSYSCHLCDETCNSLESMSLHQQNHPREKNKSKKSFDCVHCDASYRTLEKLTFHTATHDHAKKCSKCSKTFSSEKRLRSHLRTHEDKRPFECEICSASFQLKKYLTAHQLMHGERSYSCTHCNMTFKRKDLMTRHARIHQPRKLIECPFKEQTGCQLKFTRNDKLKLHLRSHVNKLTRQKPNKKHCKKISGSSTKPHK